MRRTSTILITVILTSVSSWVVAQAPASGPVDVQKPQQQIDQSMNSVMQRQIEQSMKMANQHFQEEMQKVQEKLQGLQFQMGKAQTQDQVMFPNAEERDWETRIFQLQNVDPNELFPALTLFRARVQPNASLRLLSVRAPKEIMPAIEDAIKRLDVVVPVKTAELMVYMLLASEQVDASAAVPSALQPVVNQLKTALPYKSFNLADTFIVRVTDSRTSPLQLGLRGIFPMPGSILTDYRLGGRARIEAPAGK